MISRFKYFIPLIVFIAIMVSFAKNLSLDKKPHSNVVGRKADLSTLVFDSDDVYKGEPLILHFFSSWCSTCHKDHIKIEELKKKHNLKIVGVYWQDSAEKIKQWVVENPGIYDNIAHDPTDRIIVSLGVVGVPETFIINRDKTIIYNEKGDISEEEFLNALSIELAKQ